jgi:hypothetical protein
MLGPDLALVNLINRTANFYAANPPAYITYTERMHVSSPTMGRTEDINRYVAVRQADDYAVMQDLPQGARRTGEAFPIIPYFDPLGQNFGFSWFANLKRLDISLDRKPVGDWPLPPADRNVDVVVPYISFWIPSYLPGSTQTAEHFRIDPVPGYPPNDLYPYDVTEDSQTHLPSRIELRTPASDEDIVLDYQVVQGHWLITHGSFTSTQHFGPLTFKVIADVLYENIAFPQTPPDPALAGSPSPSPAATPGTSPTPAAFAMMRFSNHGPASHRAPTISSP